MGFWLYQLSANIWKPENYRLEVWEGKDTYWDVGRITPAGSSPAPGDTIILFYAKSGAVEPGIYGIGIVTNFDVDAKRITFRPCPPSDFLKLKPLWNAQVETAMNDIRGSRPQGNMWEVGMAEWDKIKAKL